LIDVGVVNTTRECQIGNDPATSDYSMENDILADSEYESSSGYDGTSLMDVDVDSVHGPSTLEIGNEGCEVGTPGDEAMSPKEIQRDVPRNARPLTPPTNFETQKPTQPMASNDEAGPSTARSKGTHKVVDHFGDTKRRAAEVLKKVKRKLTSDNEDGGSANETQSESRSHGKRPQKTLKFASTEETAGGPVGNSNSAKASRLLNEQVNNRTFKKHETKWPRFKKAIQDLDKDAEFNIDGDPRKVQHSLCLRPQKMDEPYNTTAFKKHVNSCSGPTKAAQKRLLPRGTQTLFTMAAANNWRKMSPTERSPLVELPCPGLTELNIPSSLKQGFKTYLIRSPLPGGGGSTVDEMTQQLFPGREYTSLSDHLKNEVRSAQRQRYCWHNHADLQKIFSATCCKTVLVQHKMQPLLSCLACIALVTDKAFKQALAVPLPLDKNRKYTPKTLIDHAAVQRYGAISGLKDLIDANERVSQSMIMYYLCNNSTSIGSTHSLHPLCQECY